MAKRGKAHLRTKDHRKVGTCVWAHSFMHQQTTFL